MFYRVHIKKPISFFWYQVSNTICFITRSALIMPTTYHPNSKSRRGELGNYIAGSYGPKDDGSSPLIHFPYGSWDKDYLIEKGLLIQFFCGQFPIQFFGKLTFQACSDGGQKKLAKCSAAVMILMITEGSMMLGALTVHTPRFPHKNFFCDLVLLRENDLLVDDVQNPFPFGNPIQ